MKRDPFLRFFLLKKALFVFNLLFILTLFAFNFSEGEDPTSFFVTYSLEFSQENQIDLCAFGALGEPFSPFGYQTLKEKNGAGITREAHLTNASGWEYLAVCSKEEDQTSSIQDEQVGENTAADIQIQIPVALARACRPYHPIIVDAASRYDVDPDLVKAIIMAESGYDPQAVSSEGATGLMQLMPRTAEALGVKDAFNPKHNVDGGVRHLKDLLEEFHYNIELTLAAYNVGSGTVKRHQGIPPINATRYYIKKVVAYYRYYKNKAISQTDSV
jgi:soluble lytic murein transglycosylase-like protein